MQSREILASYNGVGKGKTWTGR